MGIKIKSKIVYSLELFSDEKSALLDSECAGVIKTLHDLLGIGLCNADVDQVSYCYDVISRDDEDDLPQGYRWYYEYYNDVIRFTCERDLVAAKLVLG